MVDSPPPVCARCGMPLRFDEQSDLCVWQRGDRRFFYCNVECKRAAIEATEDDILDAEYVEG